MWLPNILKNITNNLIWIITVTYKKDVLLTILKRNTNFKLILTSDQAAGCGLPRHFIGDVDNIVWEKVEKKDGEWRHSIVLMGKSL